MDYFPHFAEQGKTLFILKSKFGNDGYAFWFQLLEALCGEENHFYDCNDEATWQYLLSRAGVGEITGTEILELLANLEKIDRELWQRRIIWCPKLIVNLEDVYKKRGRLPPERPKLLDNNDITTGKNCIICGKNIVDMREDALYCSDKCRQRAHRVTDSRDTVVDNKSISGTEKAISATDIPISVPEMPQRKVKERKGKESRAKESTIEQTKFARKLDVEGPGKPRGDYPKLDVEGFNKFWGAYPKKRNKGQAEKAFEKAAPDEQLLAVILTTIEQAKKSAQWLEANGKFIPYPATWLNAKGWEDEYEEESSGKARRYIKSVPGNRPAGAFADLEDGD